MNVSAYIPCCNNEQTIAESIASLRAQTVPVAELFVIDDASTDGSTAAAKSSGARVVAHVENLGRGAGRAHAMLEAQNDLVLACDAAIALPPDFLARALTWMNDPNVAAVFGRVVQTAPRTVVERWRGRHLFKSDSTLQLNRRASLATGGVLLRKSLVLQAGNFNPHLRQSEDADLGQRLLARGHDVVFDPELKVTALGRNTLSQLLERYWRWNFGADAELSVATYLKQISYSIKVMARADLRQSDFASAAISLLCPHYLFWQANLRRAGNSKL